jgi:hypothetical protein
MKQKILAAALMFGASMAQAADPLMGNRKTRADDNGHFGRAFWAGILGVFRSRLAGLRFAERL